MLFMKREKEGKEGGKEGEVTYRGEEQIPLILEFIPPIEHHKVHPSQVRHDQIQLERQVPPPQLGLDARRVQHCLQSLLFGVEALLFIQGEGERQGLGRGEEDGREEGEGEGVRGGI